MGKKQSASSAKRIKTRHKKRNNKIKLITKRISPAIKDINKVISQSLKTQPKQQNSSNNPQKQQQIPEQSIPIDSLKKLTSNTNKKKKLGKLSIDDGIYLQKLIKKWGNNYSRMAQDIQVNRLQWTAQQIQKKYQIYKKMFPTEEALQQ